MSMTKNLIHISVNEKFYIYIYLTNTHNHIFKYRTGLANPNRFTVDQCLGRFGVK